MSLLWVIKFHFMRFLPGRITNTQTHTRSYLRNNVNRHRPIYTYTQHPQCHSLLFTSLRQHKRIPNWNYSFPAFCGQYKYSNDLQVNWGKPNPIWYMLKRCMRSEYMFDRSKKKFKEFTSISNWILRDFPLARVQYHRITQFSMIATKSNSNLET